MVMKCMEKLLNDDMKEQFVSQVNNAIDELNKKLSAISIKDILNIMGFPNE